MSSSTGASTSTNNDFFFGWDLLFKTIERAVDKKSDVLIALTHFILMKHSNFRCIGVGEDKTLSDDDVGSELLPDGWNDDAERYALRYVLDRQLYLLLGYKSEDCFIMNLLDVNTRKVSNIALGPDESVKKTKGSITDVMPNAGKIAERIRKELIDPVYTGSTREVTTQTNTNNPDPIDPLRVTEPRLPRGQFMPGGPARPFGLPDYGASDLDPLGRLGSGNIFPFPRHPDLTGSGQPRFDPFGPPERGVRPNPNPDHLQPPNFGGDYYS